MSAVVMVSASFFPYAGGAENQALELSKALAAMGMRITVLTRRINELSPVEKLGAVEVRRLPVIGKGLLDSISFMIGVFFWLVRRRSTYRSIHVHLAGSPALAAVLAGQVAGKRVIVKLGGGRGVGEIAQSTRTLAGRCKLVLLNWLQPRLVAVTPELTDELKAFGLDIPVTVIPNGVDADRFRPPSREERSAARRAIGLTDEICFLYVGRLSYEKQLDMLAESFGEAVAETGAQARLLLVGAGDKEPAIRAAARRSGAADKVTILPPTAEIEKVYRAADVFFLPSISEGLSNALLEAMCCGLPVIASRVGGTPEAVEDGRSGLLFDPTDQAALKSLLIRAIKEPEALKPLGEAARERAARRYAIGEIAKRYQELYQA